MLTMDIEKGPNDVGASSDRKEIISRVIIPRKCNFRPVCLWGFIGSVKEFRQFLKFQLVYLKTGVIAP